MKDLLSSAAKIVFIMLTATACIAFLGGKLASSDFMMLAGLAFSFYFSNKGDSNSAYLGK